MNLGIFARKPTINSLIATCGLLGCNASTSSNQPQAATRKGWQRSEVAGWKYTHKTATRLEHDRFTESGELYVTLIDIRIREEAPVFPMWHWAIDANGGLTISLSQGEPPIERWTLVSLDETSANVLIHRRATTFQHERYKR